MAYFDNAATTYPKPECVYTFMDQFYRQSGGNWMGCLRNVDWEGRQHLKCK